MNNLMHGLVDINPFSNACSTLPCPGYSMWNPWKGGWTAEIPGGFHGMVDGFHGMGAWIPWNGGWIPYFWWMDSMEWWMDSMVFPHGFHTFSILFPYGFHTFSSWNKFLESSIHTHALKFKLEWGLID